jgi:hypothetical protein
MGKVKLLQALGDLLTKLKCKCKSSCCQSECSQNPSPRPSEGKQDIRNFAYKIEEKNSV